VFTFDLPGLLTRPLHRDGLVLPPGTPVLPVAAAAHADPKRPRGGHLAWGSGIHRCLGAAVAEVALGEALSAVASLPGIGLARSPGAWLEGTMPVPAELPVTT
jgi:cytochrome P450